MVVEKDHVHVAGVVHFTAAELAHREHDGGGRPAAGVGRHAETVHELPFLAMHDHAHQSRGEPCERGGCRLGILPTENVPHAHPQLLRRLERVEGGVHVHGAAAQFLEARLEGFRRRQPLEQQAVEQFVDHPRVAHQQPRQKRTR
ncbi:MAG: hypothetical protein LW698_11110 [Planctomycetaceae bacterium]|nr:hypothetical protein [Planctomycetaceae bacterium]